MDRIGEAVSRRPGQFFTAQGKSFQRSVKPSPFFDRLGKLLTLALDQFHAALITNLAIAARYVNNMRLATAFFTGHHLRPPQQTRSQIQKQREERSESKP
jgi:hypothetical protein